MVSFLYVGKYTPLRIQESMLGWILGYVESSVLADGGFSEPKPVFIPYAFFFWGLFSESFRLVGVVPAFLHRKDQFSLFLPKLVLSMFTGLPADKQRNVMCELGLSEIEPGLMYFNLSVMTIKFLLLSLYVFCQSTFKSQQSKHYSRFILMCLKKIKKSHSVLQKKSKGKLIT